jgi:hypothetical protein
MVPIRAAKRGKYAMSIFEQFATPAERDYDEMVEAHHNYECNESCPVCKEERYQKKLFESDNRCSGGCTLWRCGREKNHEGICQPPKE